MVFLPGCNFACPYCHNPGLVAPLDDSILVDWDDALAHLRARRGLLSGVVFSGGEPTLRRELPALVALARELGYLVKLDSNGSDPGALAAAGADFLAMDLKTAPARYRALWPSAPADMEARILGSMRVLRSSGAGYEFRITCAPGIFGPAEARELAAFLEPGDPVVLQRYRPGEVLDPAWAAGVSPYTEPELETLRDLLAARAPMTRIRSG